MLLTFFVQAVVEIQQTLVDKSSEFTVVVCILCTKRIVLRIAIIRTLCFGDFESNAQQQNCKEHCHFWIELRSFETFWLAFLKLEKFYSRWLRSLFSTKYIFNTIWDTTTYSLQTSVLRDKLCRCSLIVQKMEQNQITSANIGGSDVNRRNTSLWWSQLKN